jgi:hypothetical protein
MAIADGSIEARVASRRERAHRGGEEGDAVVGDGRRRIRSPSSRSIEIHLPRNDASAARDGAGSFSRART